jgi:hypothetical protein
MRVYRLPLNPMSLANLTAYPEFNQQYHDGLVDGMMHYAYLKDDTQTLDKKKAADHAGTFGAFIERAKRDLLRLRDANSTISVHYGAI